MMQGLEAESDHQVCQEILTIFVHRGVKPQSTLPPSDNVISDSRRQRELHSRLHVIVKHGQGDPPYGFLHLPSYPELSLLPDTSSERISSGFTLLMPLRGMPSHCESFATSISSSCSVDVNGMYLLCSLQNAFLLC